MPILVETSLTLVFWSIAIGAVWAGLLAGYGAWLRVHRMHALPSTPAEVPIEDRVDVVVAVLNEERDIGAKLENLLALDYTEAALRVFVVDGGSSDRTCTIVSTIAARDRRVHLVQHDVADKVAQLNAALPHITAPFVLVTDADARMDRGTLCALVSAMRADARMGIIGTPVARPLAHPLERCHTALIDGMRAAEARAGSASIVMGPCYLCRRDLLDPLPRDAFCDDVFLSFHALSRGFMVGFVAAAVCELRAPVSFRDLLRHKFRKAAAYLHEVLRHLPAAGRMTSPGRGVFLWRAAQFLVAPPLALAAGMLFLAAAWSSSAAIGLAATLVPPTLLVLTAARPSVLPFLQRPVLIILLNVVLLAAIAAYPFYRQSASYRKVRSMRPFPETEAA